MFWTFTSKELLSSCSLNVFQERRFAQGFRDLGLHKTWNFWLKIRILIRRLEVVCYVPERGESRSTIFWSLMQAWTNSCLLTRYQDMIRIQQNLDKYLQICFETYFDWVVPGHFAIRVGVHLVEDPLGPVLSALLVTNYSCRLK